MTLTRSVVALSLPLGLSLACGTAPSTTSTTSAGGEPGTTADALLVHRLMVHANADGTITTKEDTITQEEEAANVAARIEAMKGNVVEPDLITNDPNCAGSSMWIYPFANCNLVENGWTGTKICFSGTSSYFDLDPYQFCEYNGGFGVCWPVVYNVASYWPGVSAGFFGLNGIEPDGKTHYPMTQFAAWGSCQSQCNPPNAGSTVYLTLGWGGSVTDQCIK
jgi:hypothetical protein